MHLSQETVSILKNFSTINQSLLIKGGKQLRSMSIMKNVLSEAEIIEDFDREVAIYDLSQFLNCLSLIPGAEVNLMEDTSKLQMAQIVSTIDMLIPLLSQHHLKKNSNYLAKMFV